MNDTDTKSRVTSLSFANYAPEDYILPKDSNLSLNTLNRALLGLFNNDVYLYSSLVGKVKGLWWKYWFKDETVKGYATGDMVCVNGIEEIRFLKRYWSGVRQIVDYTNVVEQTPDFLVTDEKVVNKYLAALNEYFHLGNRASERQVYISVVDDNKDRVTAEETWKPYLVTTEELHRRENFLIELFEDVVIAHNEKWHTALDEIDRADRSYELYGAAESIYDDLLTEYLPKKRLGDKESQKWVDFISTEEGNKLLGFGSVNYDFLHIFKPLGTDIHHLESWIRSDGHVTVKGYVPVGLMTEIIPESGTQEYNRWKMGGQRRFAFRFDYPINDRLSKLFFREKKEEMQWNDPAAFRRNIRSMNEGVQQIVKVRDDSKDEDYQNRYAAVQSDIDTMDQRLTELQDGIMQTKQDQLVPQAAFPSDSDAWCKADAMIYPDGVMSPALVEVKYVRTGYRGFFFNPAKLDGVEDGKRWMIMPKFKENDSVVGLIHPKELLTKTKNGKPDSSKEWKYWTLLMDSTLTSTEVVDEKAGKYKNVYSRHVIFQLNDRSIDTYAKLLFWKNPEVRKLMSSKNGKLSDWLDNEAIDKKFRITRIEIDQKEEELTQTFTDKETGKTSKGLLHVTYDYIKQIEAAVDLIEDTSDELRMDDIVEDLGDLADDLIRDATEENLKIYTIVTYKKDTHAVVLYYPTNNKNVPFEDILESDAKAEIEKNGHTAAFKDLFNGGYEHTSNVVTAGSSVVESHVFIKMPEIPDDIDPGSETPIDSTDETDPSVVASNMRLLREFGTISSPPILDKTSSIVMPDAGQLMTPALNCCPGATLTEWIWEDGQSVIFNVPSATQNISFELTGMINKDNTDFSFYCIVPENYDKNKKTIYKDLPDNTKPLMWVWDALKFKRASAKLRIGEAEGLASDGAILHRNARHLVDGIANSLIDNLSFVSLMKARIVDWSLLFRPETTAKDGLLDEVVDEGNMLTGYQELDEMYGLLYQHIEAYMRLGYLYFVYENMLSNMMTASSERLWLMNRIKLYLTTHDYIDASAIQQKLIQGNRTVIDLMTGGQTHYAKEMSAVITQLQEYHTKHMRQSEAVAGWIPSVTGEDSTNAWKHWHDAFSKNIEEIRVYLTETQDTIDEIHKTKELLEAYLKQDLEAALNQYVRTSLAKLDFAAKMYFQNNYYIARGYVSYLQTWNGVLNTSVDSMDSICNPLNELAKQLINLKKTDYDRIGK